MPRPLDDANGVPLIDSAGDDIDDDDWSGVITDEEGDPLLDADGEYVEDGTRDDLLTERGAAIVGEDGALIEGDG